MPAARIADWQLVAKRMLVETREMPQLQSAPSGRGSEVKEEAKGPQMRRIWKLPHR